MRVDDWCEREGLSVSDLADLLGIRYSTAYRYLKYGWLPSTENMRKIFLVSRGVVQPNDFYGIDTGEEGSEDDFDF